MNFIRSSDLKSPENRPFLNPKWAELDEVKTAQLLQLWHGIVEIVRELLAEEKPS